MLLVVDLIGIDGDGEKVRVCFGVAVSGGAFVWAEGDEVKLGLSFMGDVCVYSA